MLKMHHPGPRGVTGILLTLAMTCLVFAPSAAAGELDRRPGMAVSAGFFNVGDPDDFVEITTNVAEVGVEYRFKSPRGLRRAGLKPVIGGAVNEDEAFWLYAGLRLDYAFARHWVISPMFATSFYEEGDSVDLGGSLQFRSGLELSYRFGNGQRLGVVFSHLSNAGLEDRNPGANSLALVWSF